MARMVWIAAQMEAAILISSHVWVARVNVVRLAKSVVNIQGAMGIQGSLNA